MYRTIIATVTIIAVAAVAIFGLRTYTQANTATSPVTVHDADVNWDKHINVADLGLVASKYGQAVPAGGRPVAEQNLDGNGNIKVAQQGPVDVNVLSQSTQGRVIPIAQDHSGPLSPVFVATDDCAHLDVFLTASGGTSQVYVIPSIDGNTTFNATPYAVWLAGNPPSSYGTWWASLSTTTAASGPTVFGVHGSDGYPSGNGSPFVAVEIPGNVQGSVTSSVWLYCRFG